MADAIAELGEVDVGLVVSLAHEKLCLETREAAKALDDLRDEPLLVCHELLFAQHHARKDLEAAADHAAFVRRAVPHDEHTGVGQAAAGFGREEEVRALDDHARRWAAVAAQEILPVRVAQCAGPASGGNERVRLQPVVEGVAQSEAVGPIEGSDAVLRPETIRVELGDRELGIDESQQLAVIESVGVLRAAAPRAS